MAGTILMHALRSYSYLLVVAIYRNSTSPLFLHYMQAFTYLLIRKFLYISSATNIIKNCPTAPDMMYFIAHTYSLCLYTTCVQWQTKCELTTCITHMSCVFTGTTKLRTTVRMHAKFLSFTLGKYAATHEYQHKCVKFKLSCTVHYSPSGYERLPKININVTKSQKSIYL